MKKTLLICILCGVILTGCSSKTDLAVTSETQVNASPVTTFTTTETTETSDTTTATTTIVTTIPDEITISAKEEVQTENVPPKVITTAQNATTTVPVTTTTGATEAPKPKATTTTTTTATTVVPISAKRLDATFKAELVECAKEYCSTIGYIYSDNYSDWGCTPSPKNTSWDIPSRTVDCTTNTEIKEYVVNSISFLKRSGYDDLVVCLYFEEDSQASGEWRIYVLF